MINTIINIYILGLLLLSLKSLYIYTGGHPSFSTGADIFRAGYLPLDSFDSFGKHSCTDKVMDSG